MITLYEPAKIFLDEELLGNSNFILDGKILSPPRFPLWATCADLLVNSVKKELIGLTYFVGSEGKEIVEFFAEKLDSRVIRYINSSLDKRATHYINNGITPDHFEIRWSLTEVDSVEIAQIDSDYWYYDEISDKDYKFMAIGLNYISEILRDYELTFPTNIFLELFEPKFVEISANNELRREDI